MDEIDWKSALESEQWAQPTWRILSHSNERSNGDEKKIEGKENRQEIALLQRSREQLINDLKVELIADPLPKFAEVIEIEELSQQLFKNKDCVLIPVHPDKLNPAKADEVPIYQAKPHWNTFLTCVNSIPTLTNAYRFGKHSPYVSEFSPYVNEFIKRFGKYVIDLDDPTAPSRRLEPENGSEILIEIYHDLLRFHYRLNSRLMAKAVKDRMVSVSKNQKRMQHLIESLLMRHQQFDMLYLELGYMPVQALKVTFEESERARVAFFRYLNQWPHLGYAWRLERSFHLGFQYQLVVFFDTQNKDDVLAIAVTLGEFWRALSSIEKKKMMKEDTKASSTLQPEMDDKSSDIKKHPIDARRYVIYDVVRQKTNQTTYRSQFYCGRTSQADTLKLDDLCFQMTMPAYLLRWNPNYLEQLHLEMDVEKEVLQIESSTNNAHRPRSEKEYIEDEIRYAEMILAKRSESKKTSTKNRKYRTFQTSVFPRGKSRNLLKRFKLALEESI